MVKCNNCKFYSTNIDDDTLRDGFCCFPDVGGYCQRNLNDYCSRGKAIVTCENCIYNKKISENDLKELLADGINIHNVENINKCSLNKVTYLNGKCQMFKRKEVE